MANKTINIKKIIIVIVLILYPWIHLIPILNGPPYENTSIIFNFIFSPYTNLFLGIFFIPFLFSKYKYLLAFIWFIIYILNFLAISSVASNILDKVL